MDDFVINVRQIGNYQQLTHIGANDLILVQQGGLGGAYGCVTQDGLLSQVYQRLNVGILPAPDNKGVISSYLITPLGQRQGFNWYVDEDGVQRYLQNGPAGNWNMMNTSGDLVFSTVAPGEKDDPINTPSWTELLLLDTQGNLSIAGVLQMTGTPSGPDDVVIVSWVQANTVASFNTRIGPVTLTVGDVNGALGISGGDAVASQSWVANHFASGSGNFAPINSPAFTGIPTAPTATAGTSTGQLATTAFVQAAVAGTMAGVTSWNTRTGAVTLTLADVTGTGILSNTALAGIPTASTAAANTATTQLATTAFVMNAVSSITGGGTGAGVSSFNGRSGVVTLSNTDITTAGGALLASPALTGVPTGPTAAPGTSTTQLATTAFVTAAGVGGVSSFNTRTGAITLTGADVTAAGGALLVGPTFTGMPSAPTAAPGTNTAQLATTAFVTAGLAANAGVTSFNTRAGAITLTSADITAAGGALLASPGLTGTPTAPTATAGTSSTQIATTAFVTGAIAAVPAGVTSFNTRTGAITLTSADITTAGGATLASPAFSGTPTAPTAPANSSTTQVATTAFVQSVARGPGTRVQLANVVISSGAVSVPIFFAFNTNYDLYEIEIYNLKSSSGDVTLEMQISTDGSSWSGLSNYNSARFELYPTAATITPTGLTAQPYCPLASFGVSPGYLLLRFQQPAVSMAHTWSWEGYQNTALRSTTKVSGAGGYTVASVILGFMFIPAGGSFGAGTITIYGLTKPN